MNFVATNFYEARYEIGEEKSPEVSNMCISINSWAARVETQSPSIANNEFSLLPALGVVQVDAGLEAGIWNHLPDVNLGGVEGDDLTIFLPYLVDGHQMAQKVSQATFGVVRANTDPLADVLGAGGICLHG